MDERETRSGNKGKERRKAGRQETGSHRWLGCSQTFSRNAASLRTRGQPQRAKEELVRGWSSLLVNAHTYYHRLVLASPAAPGLKGMTLSGKVMCFKATGGKY